MTAGNGILIASLLYLLSLSQWSLDSQQLHLATINNREIWRQRHAENVFLSPPHHTHTPRRSPSFIFWPPVYPFLKWTLASVKIEQFNSKFQTLNFRSPCGNQKVVRPTFVFKMLTGITSLTCPFIFLLFSTVFTWLQHTGSSYYLSYERLMRPAVQASEVPQGARFSR